jgi:ABC-type lipoprotein export system ATPase subunit
MLAIAGDSGSGASILFQLLNVVKLNAVNKVNFDALEGIAKEKDQQYNNQAS